MKLVFATHNLNKAKEISAKLGKQHELFSLDEIGFNESIPEDYDTLDENAHQKAITVFSKTGLNCFADDTGLEVQALNGAPGVFSARYAGEPANSDANIDKLLNELGTSTNRNAQFRTVICLINNGEVQYFEGIAKGHIINERKGKDGFGYDPVFIPEGFDRTFAEMTMDEKNKISHRAKAFNKLLAFLG